MFLFLCLNLACVSDIQKNSPQTRVDTYIVKKTDRPVLFIDVYLPEQAEIQGTIVPQSSLDFTLQSPPQEQIIGKQRRIRYQYEVQGKPNSYVIRFDDITYIPSSQIDTISQNNLISDENQTNKQLNTIKVDPLFYDLDVVGPIAEVPSLIQPSSRSYSYWLWGVLIASIGLFYLYRRTRKTAFHPNLGKNREELLLEKWKEVMLLDEHSRSVAISNLMREYLSEIYGQPFTQYSQSEVLHWLRRSYAPVDVKKHIENIITATDRLKFSREGGGEKFFSELILSRDYILKYHKNNKQHRGTSS